MNQYSIVAIHGIGMGTGIAREGFSDPLRKLSAKAANTEDFIWKEFIWETENDELDSRIEEIVREVVRGSLLPSLFGANEKKSPWKKILAVASALTIQNRVAQMVCKAVDLGLDFPWYLDSIKGQNIRKRLRKQIQDVQKESGTDVVLIAHSLGSVIAYDCLAEAYNKGFRLPVAKLVTFGSPLGWTFELRDLDNRPEREFTTIGGIPWRNYYYKEDYVPLYKGLDGKRFGKEVENRLLPLPEGVKPHKSHEAYWKDANFAKEISRFAGLSGKTGS